MTVALAALLLGALLAGCGPADTEVDETPAVADDKANTAPAPWEPRPCPGGEILQADPTGTLQSIRPGCFDQAVAEAITEFPEPLPPGTEWRIRTPDFADPQEHMPVILDGNQDVMVAEYWLCAWMDSYLQAVDSNDAPGQAAGMAHLSRYTQLPAIQANHANPEVFETTVIGPAKENDPTNLRAHFKSCSNYLH